MNSLEVPPGICGGFEKGKRWFVGAKAEVTRGCFILHGQQELSVAVSDDGVCFRHAIACFWLAHCLADYRCADFAAAYNRQHIVDMRNVQVCEVVENETHGNGEPVLCVVAIGAAAKAGKSLFDKETGKSFEAVIYVVDGHEQGALLSSKRAEVDAVWVAARI